MISSIISRLVILLFGTLYPAYASYKAVRTKDIKEYFKWMMYWIVFALFTCAETFTDVFFSWFPFYYEIKIVIVLWLLSPATKGSSILYKKFVHPMLCKREQEIDEYIAKAKEQSYKQVLDIGAKGVNVLMQTAIKNFNMPSANLPLQVPIAGLRDEPDDFMYTNNINCLHQVDELYSDEEDLDLNNYETDIRKPKSKREKSKKKPATRKSARKNVKAETVDMSE